MALTAPSHTLNGTIMMRILNAMFSTGLGGIEQSFADYCHALAELGHDVIALTQPASAINATLSGKLTRIEIRNRGQWDIFAKSKIKQCLVSERPDIIIAHGNRPISLLQSARNLGIPLVGVAHNYKLQHMKQCDAVFTVSQDLRNTVITKGLANAKQCFHIPNMIHSIAPPPRQAHFRNPVRITTMGRFVEKKGFHLFLEALALLKSQGFRFSAVIGGDGDEKDRLLALRDQLSLANDVSFCGWVKNKSDFFADADIFCLPSLHEPFGIVLLEAFIHGIPVVSTASEGPAEIGTHMHDCILTENHSAQALGQGLKTLIEQETLAQTLSHNAEQTVLNNYTPHIVANKITVALKSILSEYG